MRFRHALLATGATPTIPPIPGLDGFPFLTSDTLWDLTALPDRLAVLGGGSIGCELGQAFARLGPDAMVGFDRLLVAGGRSPVLGASARTRRASNSTCGARRR